MSNHDWKAMGFGSYSVTILEHFVLKIKDGTKIAMKIFLPFSKSQLNEHFSSLTENIKNEFIDEICKTNSMEIAKYPTVVEYLPYAKDTPMTIIRDYNRHPWLASHGYVVLRVDIRGTGASSGYMFDEYSPQELDDCQEIIDWIVAQRWSNGRVGMYGKSWGGFNGLQMAYRQPSALKAVISLYSSVDRFANDVHYQGGGVFGTGMLSWSNFMFSINARPPPRRYFDSTEDWLREYKDRLEGGSQSFLSTWLHHQHADDPYWLRGSIKTDYSRVQCPVLAIGGHADLYTNSAFQMAAHLNSASRVIIGPWSHQWPDVSVVGPNVDFMQICLKWWDSHLKVPSSNTIEWPRLQLYVLDSSTPKVACHNPSTWVGIDNWNELIDRKKCAFYLHDDMKLRTIPSSSTSAPVSLKPHVKQGSGAGLSFSINYGFPLDQKEANDYSLCWVSENLESDLNIVGNPVLTLNCSVLKRGDFSLQVRLCDQLLSGHCTLVTRGCAKISMDSSSPADVTINLDACAKTIRAGHRLVIAISPTYFPSLFSVNTTGGNISLNVSGSRLEFTTLTENEMLRKTAEFGTPKPLLQYPGFVEEAAKRFESGTQQHADKFVHTISEYSGRHLFPSLEYRYEELLMQHYSTNEAVTFCDIAANSKATSSFRFDGTWHTVEVTTRQQMNHCPNRFEVEEEIKVTVDEEVFFEKRWDYVVPRTFV